MRRTAVVIRLFAVLSLGLWLAGAAAATVRAQDAPDGTPTATDGSSSSQSAAQGTLVFAIYTCTSGPADTTGKIFAPGDFTPDASCTEGGSADVSIDSTDSQSVSDGDQLQLDAGDHAVDEDSIGSPVTVTVPADDAATVSIVFYDVVSQAATGTVSIVKHICPAAVTDQTSFDALGDFYAKALACPVITLPGDTGPDGSINGNDANNPLSFDFTVAFDDNGNPVSNAIDTATFTPTQACEVEDLGQDINGNPNDDVCLDQSSYSYADVVEGAVTVTEVTPPAGYQFGAVEFVPNSGQESTLVSATADTGEVDLDTSGVDSVTLHVFNFATPPVNRIDIVKHQCAADITTQSELDAIGGYYDKLLACPVVLRGGDNGPAGAISGGHRTFAFDVQGADAQVQTLDNATFVPAQICESDLGQDINNNPNDDVCLDASYYRFDNVQQGQGVTVTETKSPKGYGLGALEFDPASGDDASLVGVTGNVIQLDTTNDGQVTLHVFNLAKPATPTPTPTKTPTRTPTPTPTSTPEPQAPVGTLQIFMFYCTGDDEYTEIDPLGPGEEADLNNYIDDTCVAGAADFEITAFGSDDLGTYSVGDDGQLVVPDLPVTDGATGPHSLTELYSSETGDFDIEQDRVTRVIVLSYEPDAIDSAASADNSSSTGEDNTDAGNVASGNDLPNTGIGPANGPVDGGAVLMMGAMGLLLLAGAAALRKRSV
jgi:hypothetical protein